MTVNIDQIKVNDRIRKDFGDLQELADDIKTNGLINPPVVIAETDRTFTLLAGERRLRACRDVLGWNQIEVRTWSTLTDEQALNLEISENEVRKDFSKSERLAYARRLERIESAKAQDRQEESRFGSNMVRQNSDAPQRTDDVVAEKLGIGSRDTYRKEKFIVDNQDQLTPEDFADWDEGRLSTNKAYQKIKSTMAEQERKIRSLEQQLDVKDQELANAHDENEDLHKQLENQEVRVETRTVIPDDYDTLKSEVENYEKKLQSQHNEYRKLFDDYTESLKRISLYEEQEGIQDFNQKLERDAVLFCSKVSGFLVDVGGYAYIPDHIDLLPQNEKDAYVKSVRQLVSWGVNLIKYFNDEGMIE